MRCPRCKNHVLQKSGKRVRLRTQGPITFEEGVCKTQCYWCKEPIEVPLEISNGTLIASEKFVLPSKP